MIQLAVFMWKHKFDKILDIKLNDHKRCLINLGFTNESKIVTPNFTWSEYLLYLKL